MLSDPLVMLTCDLCGAQEEYGLTSLACGGWDDRNLKSVSEGYGWTWVDEDVHHCSDCSEDCEMCDICGLHIEFECMCEPGEF